MGIIPANTGRIVDNFNGLKYDRDHPREYGENVPTALAAQMHRGSSPRIRGECPVLPGRFAHQGIIPANTGRIVMVFGVCKPRQDHPREYGENVALPLLVTIRRIIPANTGRITSSRSSRFMGRDHPREYGENPLGQGL